jgi:hypothetical protein
MSISAGMAAALSEMALSRGKLMASRGAHQQWRNGVALAWRRGVSAASAAWHQRKIISISAAAKAQNGSDLKAKSGSESVTGGVISKYVKEKISVSAGVSWRRRRGGEISISAAMAYLMTWHGNGGMALA